METLTLAAFCLVLVFCIMLKLPLLLALGTGLFIFLAYGSYRKFSFVKLLQMCWESILTVQNILITFFLIGMLTATWRVCGTIPVIISLATGFINPASFFLTTFLLTSLIAFLIGTSFGTAATIGVICMSMAQTMDMDSFWTAGAIISGCYFGDRCSPVSTSALLIATLTKTELHDNIKLMFKTCWLPLLATCAIYYGVGMNATSATASSVQELFAQGFVLSSWCVLPAIVILVLSLLRIPVKPTMSISIAFAIVLGMLLQNMSLSTVGSTLLFGYESTVPELAKMLNGGGLISMVTPAAIVCIASCYSGIFQGTGLLNALQDKLLTLRDSCGTFAAILATAILTAMIACNQTLNIMLTHQLCTSLELPKEELAIDLEDTAVLVSPLTPWNIAAAVPLAAIGAPAVCLLAACYLYLLPLYRLVVPASCPVRK